MRSCYRTKMRFNPASDVETWVRWFFVPPGTAFIPFYTRFASGNYASGRLVWPGVGEVLEAPRQWVNGAPPAVFPAQQVCGTPAQWATGLAPPDPMRVIPPGWVPDCCGTVLPPPPDPCDINAWMIAPSGFTGVFCQQWEGHYTLERVPSEDCAWLAWVIEPLINWNLIDVNLPPEIFVLQARRVSDGAVAWQGQVLKSAIDTMPGGTTVVPYTAGSSICGDPQPDVTLVVG